MDSGITSSEGIFAVLSSPVPGTKGPPRRSERLQARCALAQAISTTIKNPTAKLYLLQSVESDNTDPQDDPDSSSIFVNVSIPLPLQTILKVVPGLKSALSSLREALNPQGIHTTLPMELYNPILCLAVLETGAPIKIISSHLVRRLGFLPDISYADSFFTAGVESIKYNGAYSSVPLRFGELVVTYPAVVLESESYDMLIGTDFLRTYQTEISHLHGHFSILGYTVPLLFKDSSDVFLVSKEETVAVDTGLYLDLPPGLHLDISSINGVLRKEPLAAPGIHDSAATETLKVLLLNLLSTEMKVSKGQHMATLRIGHNEDLSAVHFLGSLVELRISLPDKPLVAAIIPQDDMVGLTKDEKDSFEALLDEFKDIFATSNEELGCAEGELHKDNVGDVEPILQRA
ncbi:DNA damage-inducible protein 1 [Entomophthora muscae]|uniref:DNA damage-inducible protein 1 n=1 Tax=Entomophthora muscae TaxID=34485 RepID=A0ACC2RUU5_9FUNG|nr:DNA damage-inducible protein 1 [Entomophthora muscae]